MTISAYGVSLAWGVVEVGTGTEIGTGPAAEAGEGNEIWTGPWPTALEEAGTETGISTWTDFRCR